MSNYIKIGCEIFVIKNGEVLMGKRKNIYGAGEWGLPGGHLEYGEKLVEAAKRELKEETGIEAEQLTLNTISDDPRSDQHYLHISFVLNNFDGEVILKEPDKCEEWKFFPLNQLPENIFIGHRPIIETFNQKKLYLY
jgi:8-oxo-dGTP diphosphatase